MEKKIEKREIKKDEHAVSPVIGTILMVAITVMLASIVGALSFGMCGDMSQLHIVVVTAERLNATAIDFTYAGGPGANFVQYLNVSVDGTFRDITLDSPPVVGSTWTYNSDTALSDRSHVIAVATFGDGSAQVVLDTFV
ncbi:MAG: type IV pilin N-terminal domain-containing protein [Euryarchaeota archaeon]|nr:type IV pilin N-terminal domain-containing protein [Euryarchaeota archaeon]